LRVVAFVAYILLYSVSQIAAVPQHLLSLRIDVVPQHSLLSRSGQQPSHVALHCGPAASTLDLSVSACSTLFQCSGVSVHWFRVSACDRLSMVLPVGDIRSCISRRSRGSTTFRYNVLNNMLDSIPVSGRLCPLAPGLCV
jgi:hypothetical protein